MSEKNLIGPTVHKLRTEKGWTQVQLAQKLVAQGWPCTTDDVVRIENRQAEVSDAQFILLGFVLEVELADLFPSHLAKQLPR